MSGDPERGPSSDEAPPAAQSPTGIDAIRRGVPDRRVIGRCLAFAAGVVLLLAIFDPFRSVIDNRMSVADHWADSIGRLGVTAVFPPQEDFLVGDVRLVAEGTRDGAELTGRSIRIGHVDVGRQLLRGATDRLAFEPSVPVVGAGSSIPWMGIASTDGPVRIRATSIAFPTTKVARSSASEGLFDLLWATFGARRRNEVFDAIEIPQAGTYGIDVSEGYALLGKWCASPDTERFCRDEDARKLLAFSLGPEVQGRDADAYDYVIKIQLVTRVYLTRSIVHTFNEEGERSAGSGAIPMKDSSVGAAAEAEGPVRGGTASEIRTGESGRTEQTLSETYRYPVVFGYNAISGEISEPPK